MLLRDAAPYIRKLAEGFPVVGVVGPRQSGKTTLVRSIFDDRPYVNLEAPDALDFATRDPRGFLTRYADGAVIDEMQRSPPLFSYLQTMVDEDGRMGRFIITGSSQLDLRAGVSQSLAGRVALVPLLPFSLGELQAADRAPRNVSTLLFGGLYPPIHDRTLDPALWLGNYVASYVERDVLQILRVRDLGTFQRFVRLCAGRTGQLLNLSALGADAGISYNTAREWISVLEATFIVHLLPPHHRNFNKRLTKTPKLYFYDPGLATWLLGIESPRQLDAHRARGALFETWVVSEMLKARYHRGLRSNLYFWRDRGRIEIDVVVDRGDRLVPIEIKSGQTIGSDFFRGLQRWSALAGDEGGQPWLIYGGDDRQRREGVEVVPWAGVEALFDA